LRQRNCQAGIHFGQRGLNEFCHRFRFQIAQDRHVNEWEIFLRPRPIKFHARFFFDSLRPNIANDANNFGGHTKTRHQ
jgi:hypothetical protein